MIFFIVAILGFVQGSNLTFYSFQLMVLGRIWGLWNSLNLTRGPSCYLNYQKHWLKGVIPYEPFYYLLLG